MGTIETLAVNLLHSAKAIIFSPNCEEKQKIRAFDQLGTRFIDLAKLSDNSLNRILSKEDQNGKSDDDK